jgi:hypothetical protein
VETVVGYIGHWKQYHGFEVVHSSRRAIKGMGWAVPQLYLEFHTTTPDAHDQDLDAYNSVICLQL